MFVDIYQTQNHTDLEIIDGYVWYRSNLWCYGK